MTDTVILIMVSHGTKRMLEKRKEKKEKIRDRQLQKQLFFNYCKYTQNDWDSKIK